MRFYWETDSYGCREGGEKPIAVVLIVNERSDSLIRRPTRSILLCRLWDLIALIDLHVNPRQTSNLEVWKNPMSFRQPWLDEEEKRWRI